MKKDDREKLKHFSRIITKEVREYATNVVLEKSRYIFTTGYGMKRTGYCTHCKKEFQARGAEFKHNESTECPKCASACVVKGSGYGKKYLYDYGTFITYAKSKIDSSVILAVYCYTSRDYKGDFKSVKTSISIQVKYFFKAEDASMYVDEYSNGWERQKSIYNYLQRYNHYGYYRDNVLSLFHAVAGTPFSHIYKCFMYKSDEVNCIEKLALYCKYPKIEYIIKAGYYNLLDKYANGASTGRTISWRSKTLHKFLRLSVEAYNKIKRKPLTFKRLFLIQKIDRKGLKWTGHQMDVFLECTEDIDQIEMLTGFLTIEKIVNYIERQMQYKDWCHSGMGERPRYETKRSVFWDWRDYIRQCQKLDYNLHDDNIIRPKDLESEHTKLSELISYKENKELDEKIAARFETLSQRYEYEYNGLIMRPAKSSAELIKEGAALKHCVGGYARFYANGTKDIFFIRKIDKPDTPFFTVELHDNYFAQARGYKNIDYRKVGIVAAFIKQYKTQILNEKERQAS